MRHFPRFQKKNESVYMCLCVCVCVYIYIYMGKGAQGCACARGPAPQNDMGATLTGTVRWSHIMRGAAVRCDGARTHSFRIVQRIARGSYMLYICIRRYIYIYICCTYVCICIRNTQASGGGRGLPHVASEAMCLGGAKRGLS